MKTTLLTLNEPNKNGRTYSSAAVEGAMKRYLAKGVPILVQSEFAANFGQPCIEKTVGVIEDHVVEGNDLIGTLKLFPGMEHFTGLACRPSFIGTINGETGEVNAKDLELISFSFTTDPA